MCVCVCGLARLPEISVLPGGVFCIIFFASLFCHFDFRKYDRIMWQTRWWTFHRHMFMCTLRWEWMVYLLLEHWSCGHKTAKQPGISMHSDRTANPCAGIINALSAFTPLTLHCTLIALHKHIHTYTCVETGTITKSGKHSTRTAKANRNTHFHLQLNFHTALLSDQIKWYKSSFSLN